MLTIRRILLSFTLSLCGMGSAHAILIDRGAGLIYDTDLNVTWLQDAQYALTTGAASPGMSWAEANAWVGNLEYYDSVRDVSFGDWRLPGTVNLLSSRGYDTTGLSSELAYMYYVNLGYAANLTPNPSDPAPTSSNYNPFINLATLGYWSGTEGPVPDRQQSWAFHFHFGLQAVNDQSDRLRIWAVTDGDVASMVPGPEDAGLFLLGIAGLVIARRRRNAG